jgi:hypothetical protein
LKVKSNGSSCAAGMAAGMAAGFLAAEDPSRSLMI